MVGGRTVVVPALAAEIIATTTAETFIVHGDFLVAILYEGLATCRGHSSGLWNSLIAWRRAPHIRHRGSSTGSLYLFIW
jgi:hypothetical protein